MFPVFSPAEKIPGIRPMPGTLIRFRFFAEKRLQKIIEGNHRTIPSEPSLFIS
jgi:hypothetical protein